MDSKAHQAIKQAAGSGNYSTDAQQLLLYSYDASGKHHAPEAVVRAMDREQISRVLAACNTHRVPILARGAGSGMTGGTVPVAGGVVLDMAGLNRILEIDKASQIARVEPGVVTADLQAAASAQGLFYPPDPASVSFCTVGGNVAENAGGLRAVKYGVTRDYVLALKAVLPDGRLFETGRSTIKSVVGYDLTRLLVGSEGTLAVITEITFRLLPMPETKATLSGFFHSLDQAAQGVQDVLGSGIRPVALEFMDRSCLQAVEAYEDLNLPSGRAAMVLVELDGDLEVVERQAQEIKKVLERAGADPVLLAKSAEESEGLWRARRVMGPAIRNLAPNKMSEDIAVPLGSLAEMIHRLEKISEERGILVPSFGHAGDGNLHVNVVFDASIPGQSEQADQAVSDIFAHTLNLGGTLSGEHGVGLSKLGFIGAEMDPVGLELMRQVKKVFDPAGILNPHKKIPSPEIVPPDDPA